MSRKTIPLKVGAVRLQNVASWVQDLSEEWVEQIYDLVEPGGQIIFVYSPSFLSRDGWTSPQDMKLPGLVETVMFRDEDNKKLMRNFLSVAQKQRDNRWIIYAGHVGKKGHFITNQSGYTDVKNTDAMPKIYDTVIVLEKRAKHSIGLIKLAATLLGAGALTALAVGVFEWHRKRAIKVQKSAENEKRAQSSNPGQQKNISTTKVSSRFSPRHNRQSRLAEDMASRSNVKSSAAGNRNVPGERRIDAYRSLAEKRHWVEKAVELTRKIIEDDRRKRKTPASKRQCEMHALLLNYILNSMGIKSQVIGLDYRWLNPHWMGLHYCVLIEDEIFTDAYPEGNKLFDEWLTGRGFILFSGDQFYNEYAEGLRQAQVRIYRAIPPERLLDYKNYSDQLNSLKEIYMSKIDALTQKFSKATNLNKSGLLESLNVITAINAAA
ncbi:MAG: hypothetical protein ISS45_12605 [Candidatus Omnitrophica bacterium]|nr:hypothetical protein [Candidatus Omnitrophota bacterium]